VATGIAVPMLSHFVSGGPLIIAGLFSTLLNNRLKLQAKS